VDLRHLRDTLGKFATGVCIITAEGKGVAPFGMTINSFSSLSLEPALILWSIGKSSECIADFEVVEQFSVNVLGDADMFLSDRYSTRRAHGLVEGDWVRGDSGCPVLRNPLARLECDIDQRIDAGDHVILIGRVSCAWYGEESEPLVFYSGKYRTLENA
jgi:flavin reductase (DIM6/NTAB) family NADH-FMN oxidoreductase RutF